VPALPPNKQQGALRLLDTLAGGSGSEPNGTGVDRRPIWELVEEISLYDVLANARSGDPSLRNGGAFNSSPKPDSRLDITQVLEESDHLFSSLQ